MGVVLFVASTTTASTSVSTKRLTSPPPPTSQSKAHTMSSNSAPEEDNKPAPIKGGFSDEDRNSLIILKAQSDLTTTNVLAFGDTIQEQGESLSKKVEETTDALQALKEMGFHIISRRVQMTLLMTPVTLSLHTLLSLDRIPIM